MNPSSTEPLNGGIAAVEVGDGKLTIRCAPAEDLLSPPVHYDLYALSLSGLEDYDTRPVEWDSFTKEITPHEKAIKYEDISSVFELEWENRSPVSVMVVARDSASTPNLASPYYHGYIAPSDVPTVEVDPNYPWILDDRLCKEDSRFVFDPETNTAYTLFVSSRNSAADKLKFYLLKHHLLEGTWEADLLYEHPHDESMSFSGFALSRGGDIFAHVTFVISIGNVYHQYWRIDTASSSFSQWEQGLQMGDWYRSQIGHNGLPATTVLKESNVDSGYYSSWYRWYDEIDNLWKEELITDPGAQMYFYTRPDGVMQAVQHLTKVKPGSTLARSGKIFERDENSNWSEVREFENEKSVSLIRPYFFQSSFATVMNTSPFTWGNECDWVIVVNDDPSNSALAYSYGGGYSDLTTPTFDVHLQWLHDGTVHGYHSRSQRLNTGIGFADYSYNKENIEKRWDDVLESGELPILYMINNISGDFSYWFWQLDGETGEYQYLMRSSKTSNSSLYDPILPGWEK